MHPDRGTNQRTDADLIAVRFKHREELAPNPIQDNSKICDCETLANVIIAEVKTGQCALNGPWTRPEDRNIVRALKAVGCFHSDEMDGAVKPLYKRGRWANDLVTFRLFAVGETRADLVIPDDQQLTWDEIIEFCIERFRQYRRQKSSTGQWAKDGEELKKAALLRDRQEAVSEIRRLFRLNPQGSQAN